MKDQVVIITGGARGIGKAAVEAFLREEAIVVIVDYQKEEAENLAREKREEGKHVTAYGVDVRDVGAVHEMVADVLARYGKIDVLINNAGVTSDGFLTKLSKEAWDYVVDVNLSGVFHVTQAVAKSMVEKGQGSIINTTSVVGVYGNVGQTNYAATKAGLIGMTKTWAKELGKKGIRVNAVAPGFIATPMTEAVPEKILDLMKAKTPLGCLGTPEDIAGAYLYLASSCARFVNGAVLPVDGGLVL